ncbi:sushi, von Willebrand factor type A, EGF and pentraxin domain-containing protein 1-like [Saccostrea echinata]|uniref:sushi, von Willebrand factor type A, EGF and pentraxin domain-containing protein 1-like n=1 Tax=Saccostrea echinata TaxID=191078 RepID=UPI002A7F0545|nr:sushi, von Willebrand factor type A, EGF and pentraxin domain-containing protein 1-like [Saccostrea echinata]
MDRPRDLLLFLLFLQIGTKEVLGHSNEGKMGDIEIKCPSGAFFFKGYCFMVVRVPMTWEDAMTACLRSGMYLSWIEDAIENNYVATHAMSRVSQYWIGLSNMSSTAGQDEIVWTQYRMMKNKAIPLVEGLWKNLQPAEFMGDTNCVSTLKDKDDNHWIVTNCRKKLPFICKVMGAPKSPDAMYCGNGGYINQKWQCDGQNDCGDMSDEVNCSSSCTELKSVEVGGSDNITMNTQQSAYKNDSFCTWTIKAPIGVRIKVTISSTFYLEENADVLSVWTGGISLKESNFLGSVTGTPGKQQEFYSQNNYLILQLSMDHSTNGSGFTASYTTVDETKIWNDVKMLNASSSWQTLESPVYGQAVPFGLQLEWLITAESYTVVSVEFTDVDLPSNGSLKVYDGEDLMAPLVFSLTKTPEYPIYISNSKTVRIVLSTNIHEYGKFRGIQLKYKEGCMLDLMQQGKIFSPGYEIGNYPSNVTCTWHIHRNSGETRPISLRFTDFKLKLNSDYVEIYNDTTGTKLHTGNGLTGTNAITEIFSSTDGHLNVTFKSNLVLVEKGFSADFSIDCPPLTLSQWTMNSVSGKYTALNTVITLSCQTGYSFKQEEYNKESSVSLKCLPGGRWNVSRIPDCQITYCGIPPAIPNGLLKNATGPRVGDNATYECDGGFTMNVSPTIKCLANGMWESEPVCNVIDCGMPEQVPGADQYSYPDTLFGSSFNFSCQTGSTLSGKSVDGDYTVRCQENRQWGFGNLTCTGGRCTDPGTPGGAVQVVRSYEAGELLRFNCTRQGYEPVPSTPLLCVEQGTKNASWNSTDLPLCTDVTPPEFRNCPNTIYIDKMEPVSFVTPSATDNSGLVKNVTVVPPNFKSGTVVSSDLNVTYTAVDNGGNTASCTISFIIKDRKKPGLICSDIGIVSINTTEGTRVDLQTYFSDPKSSENITFSPERDITVNTKTLSKPQQVNATLQNMWGTEETCTLLIYTKADVCFTESLSPALHATKVCPDSNGKRTCTYTCESGYLYFDGSSSKNYTCSGMNKWSPSMYPESCLLTESPSYKAKFEVVYDLVDLPASSCLQGFDNSLAVYNTTIAQKVDDRCKDLKPGKFMINSFISTTKAFQIITVFSGEFTGSGADAVRSTCLQTLYIIVNLNPSSFLHNNTVLCDGGSQSSLSVKSIKGVDDGNKCSDNMVLIKPELGNSEQCVMCPPGRYFNGTSCMMCADGQYQDSVGQTSCKNCQANTVSRDDRTTCTDLCPPGFTSSDGMTECKPCGGDEYWVNATNCERCPNNSTTDGKNGVPNISGCKAPCPAGKYSLTGYEPCYDCPLHHYQTNEGQKDCTECLQDQMNQKTGSNSSADCITVGL